jgi:hypothetical protein
MTAPLPPPYLACELNGSEPVWTRDMVNRAVREALERLSQQAEPVDAHESTRMYHFAIKREQRLRELIGLVVEHVESPDHDGGISNALKQRLIDEMAAPPATQQAEPVSDYVPKDGDWHMVKITASWQGGKFLISDSCVYAAPPATPQQDPDARLRVLTPEKPADDEAVRLLKLTLPWCDLGTRRLIDAYLAKVKK